MCCALSNDSDGSGCKAASVQACMQKPARSLRYHQEPRRLEDDYLISSQVLGSGCNGDVVVATSKADPDRKFAVKSLRIPHENKDDLRQLQQEVDIHLSLDHPHIIRLCDVYESKEKLYLVMECMEGGELFQRLAAKTKFSEEEARAAVHQMLLVLSYLHGHGVVHRDVKLENFVFDKQDSKHLKLIDFGFSVRWSPDSETKMDNLAGTIHYMAPEVLSGKEYTSQCDLWSLGVIGFTLLSGTMPFLGSQHKIINSIRNGAYSMEPRMWKGISDEAKSFIKSLLHMNPTQRLSAKDALEHPWIRQAETKAPLDIVDVLGTLRDFGGASKFRRNCLHMLALFLPNEDQARVRDQFLWLAGYNGGTITIEKLSKAISEQFKVTGEGDAMQVFTAFGFEQGQEIHFSDFVVAMLGERIQFSENLVASAFQRFDQQHQGCISREDLLATLDSDLLAIDSEELKEHFVETEFLNSDGQIYISDIVAYLLDNSWKRANLVQKRRAMIDLRNTFSAWKENKRAKEIAIEQQHDMVDSNGHDLETNVEKHAKLMSTFRSILKSAEFASSFKKHVAMSAIRRDICLLGW